MPENPEQTLYERIGGEEAITGLIDSFYDKVLADPELAHYFEHTPMEKQRRMQREFFSMAAGGPIKYTGRTMSEAHRHLKISRHDFRRFTEHLIETMEEIGISEEDVLDIITKINMYVGEITGEPGYDAE